ncbi:hypothetical protein NIES2100_05470 [Calothrix sp. NIES-2100]|uniref:hypothetical protein n=1 Tax=Calothrix sp. NIES-2100 TaxID=1954172 RepID=UPI000B60C73C|nr:hypothetical protein NIES2100_05470 [Calothrix sp. NIES-2100]
MATVTYYPERENRKAARTFLFDVNKVTLNPGENEVNDNLISKFKQLETVQELVEDEVIKITEIVVNNSVLKRPPVVDDEDEE